MHLSFCTISMRNNEVLKYFYPLRVHYLKSLQHEVSLYFTIWIQHMVLVNPGLSNGGIASALQFQRAFSSKHLSIEADFFFLFADLQLEYFLGICNPSSNDFFALPAIVTFQFEIGCGLFMFVLYSFYYTQGHFLKHCLKNFEVHYHI